MKKKGFTLIELLAVIVILSLLIVIAVPSITKIISEQNSKINDQSLKYLGESALSYAIENNFLTKCANGFEPTSINSVSLSGCTIKISVNDIIQNGFFQDDKKVCDRSKYVLVYRYINNSSGNSIDEYRYFVEPDTCSVK